MATNDILDVQGTAIIVANSTHSPTAINDLGTRTKDIDISGVTTLSYRQSEKLDFGAARSGLWELTAAIEYFSAPTVGDEIEVFIGWSHSETDGTGNPGELVGADGAWVGYGAASSDADEILSQLDSIGGFALTDFVGVQVGHAGFFTPKQRYGILVFRNGAAVTVAATDSIECSFRLSPIIPQMQAAA